MTPSEEMIPRRLRFKIASHVRTADRANQLFKFGSWNRVAGNCRESGRFKKRLKKLHPTFGYHNRLGTNSQVPSPASVPSLPSDLWIFCGAVLVRSCAELYLAEMHNRCNSPHRSGPQRCQVAGRQRAGSMMCCPSVFHASLNGEGPFRWLHLRQLRSKFTVS